MVAKQPLPQGQRGAVENTNLQQTLRSKAHDKICIGLCDSHKKNVIAPPSCLYRQTGGFGGGKGYLYNLGHIQFGSNKVSGSREGGGKEVKSRTTGLSRYGARNGPYIKWYEWWVVLSDPSMFASENFNAASTGDGTPVWEQAQTGASASDGRLTVAAALTLETDARPTMTPTSKPVTKMIIGRRLVVACLVDEGAEDSDNIPYILAVHVRLGRIRASVTPASLACSPLL
jgi:hypothetical protein